MRPKLLFATIAAGGGHVATAQAMAEAVDVLYPQRFELLHFDLMKEVGLTRLDRRHKDFWRWVLAHPWLARAGQRVMNTTPLLTRRYHHLLLDRFAKEAAVFLNAHNPQLVVANHGWLTFGLTRSQRRYGLSSAVLSFATEPLDASALWAEPDAEQFVVPSSAVKRDLVRLGVAASKIDVVGYPVKQAFLRAPDKALARHRLGLEERFTCLMSLGGEGIGNRLFSRLAALLALKPALQIVVIAGRNERLKSQLETLSAAHPRLHVRGFVGDVATHIAASDVVIGKAGPASVFEALAVGRPFLVTSYAGLNERQVLRFLGERQLGGYLGSPAELVEAVQGYRSNPAELHCALTGSRSLKLREMTENLAHYVVHYAKSDAKRAAWLGPGLG